MIGDGLRILRLPVPATRGREFAYTAQVVSHLLMHHGAVDLVYSRHPFTALAAVAIGLPVVLELHNPPTNAVRRVLERLVESDRLLRMIFISEALHRLWRDRRYPVSKEVQVEPSAAPARLVAQVPVPAQGREVRNALYVGSFYRGRGIDLILDVASATPEMTFRLVGGRRDTAPSTPPNVAFHGQVPPSAVAQHYRWSDVVLMPYGRNVETAQGHNDTSAWMSPLKLFEYMATGRPILASDHPVLHEVLTDGDTAFFAPPDDPAAWIAALKSLMESPESAWHVGRNARQRLTERHTWELRAERCLAGLQCGANRASP
ncbi:MAG: glycosyltransferase [Actinomycetota bacterium]